jgi:hypothetical protein
VLVVIGSVLGTELLSDGCKCKAFGDGDTFGGENPRFCGSQRVPLHASRATRPAMLLAPALRRTMLSELRTKAFFVCDLQIPKPDLDDLRNDVESLQHEAGFYNPAGQEAHRGDRIGWISKRGAEERRLPRLAEALKFMLSDLPTHLPQTPAITAPAEGMLSLYDGGAAYAPHRDGVEDASFEAASLLETTLTCQDRVVGGSRGYAKRDAQAVRESGANGPGRRAAPSPR